MAETETTYVMTTGRGIRYHRPTCKRLNGAIAGAHTVTAEQVRANALAKPATCCKPKLPAAPVSTDVKPEHVIDAVPSRRNDTPPAAPSRSEHKAATQRASKQLKALKMWQENGEVGPRPLTPDLDQAKADYKTLNGSQDAATAPEPTVAGKRRKVTDPAEQRKLVKTLLDAGCKPSGLYKAFRAEGIMASSAWVAPLVAELTKAS